MNEREIAENTADAEPASAVTNTTATKPKRNGKADAKQSKRKRASGLDAIAQQLDKASAQLRKKAGQEYAEGNQSQAEKLMACAQGLTKIATEVGEA